MRLIDADLCRDLFDEEFKKTRKLILDKAPLQAPNFSYGVQGGDTPFNAHSRQSAH